MKTYIYIHSSNNKDLFFSKLNSTKKYLHEKGILSYEICTDKNISTEPSYNEIHLDFLIHMMQPNDCLVVPNTDRLCCSIKGLDDLINKEFKPRKLRLIIMSIGLDLDCANMRSKDEFILVAITFAAKISQEIRQERTKSALDSIQKQIKENGYFITKAGVKRERLGSPYPDIKKASESSAKARKERSINNEHNIRFAQFIEDWIQIHGEIDKNTNWKIMVDKLNKRGLKTSSGLDFDERRARAMISNLKRMNQL